MKLSIALAQIDPVLGDLNANIAKHLEWADRARTAGAGLIIFPELSLTGYGIKDLNWDLAVTTWKHDPRLQPLIEKSASISILAGGVEESSDFGVFNSAFLFEDGAVRTVHRKVYPPTYGMFEESRYFASGSSVRAFDTKHGRMGVLICEDLWHLPLPYVLAADGAQMIAVLTASPTRLGAGEERLAVSTVNSENHRAIARLLSTYIAFVNRTGFEDGVNFWGGSELIAPDGTAVGTAQLYKEDLLIVPIDENEIRRARRFSRHFNDDDPQLVVRELSRILREKHS